jgi:hypothetical protein
MSHKIELIPSGVSGARSTMFRCGQKFEIGEAKILDLTKEQLEEFKNDWRFKVSDSKDSGEKISGGTIATSETIPPTEGIFTEDSSTDEAETIANSDVAQEEEASDEVETEGNLEELLKKNSREELNVIAKSYGIQDADSFDNKTEVAQAIIDAQ